MPIREFVIFKKVFFIKIFSRNKNLIRFISFEQLELFYLSYISKYEFFLPGFIAVH